MDKDEKKPTENKEITQKAKVKKFIEENKNEVPYNCEAPPPYIAKLPFHKNPIPTPRRCRPSSKLKASGSTDVANWGL